MTKKQTSGREDYRPLGEPAPAEMPEVLAQRYDDPSARKRRPARGCMGGVFGLFRGQTLLMIVLVLVLIVVVQGVVFWGNPVDSILSALGFERDSEPEVVDSQVLVLGIRDLALLQTASGDVRIEKRVVDTGPSPDAKLRMSYLGSVAVGIDLALFDETDIVVANDNRLTVTLPPIQILDCALRQPDELDFDCTNIPLVQDCNKIHTNMLDVAYERSLEDLLRRAEEGDITTPAGEPLLNVAYVNAERAIADLLDKLGYDRISFVRSEETLPPAETCTP